MSGGDLARWRYVLNKLDALLDYHKGKADAATAKNADSAEARAERGRWAGVRDSRALFLANAPAGLVEQDPTG